ncbi:hypothetical protein BDK51DRAFT_41322 [Blyttiomyces helicus]|uniref:F-box domain-containing protein n=1 Tax=Blyttiomyces helicus TaxID=388810 RepID=A0A4P9VWH7_9FUNG|nr:hypothetical protein BDK51DRAFT_41322 [Blyttiomyces helicus]|eukprot:RKO83522.1 hypothetical protein BDK51DRAFT_41322 [Blyttiomyces helicus]
MGGIATSSGAARSAGRAADVGYGGLSMCSGTCSCDFGRSGLVVRRTEELWRSIDISEKLASLGDFNAIVKSSKAPIGLYIRAVAVQYPSRLTSPRKSPFPMALTLLPNLRCLSLISSCPRLRAAAKDFWKSDRRGKAIIEGVRRLRSRQYKADNDDDVETAINCATGLNLLAWTGIASASEQVAANSPMLKAALISHLSSLQLHGYDVRDDTAIPLLRRCPPITRLCLFNTAVTTATILALKSHRPLTMLTLAADRETDLRLFATEDAESALPELLSARGALLARLFIGEAR